MNYYNKLASRHIANDWCVRDTHPPSARLCLYICLSSLPPSPLLPQSLPQWCYLWVCVSVGRRWRSVWLNPDKETNSSANRHRRGRGGGWGGVGCVGVARKTKQTKDRMPKLYSNTKQWGSCWIQSPLLLLFSRHPLQNTHNTVWICRKCWGPCLPSSRIRMDGQTSDQFLLWPNITENKVTWLNSFLGRWSPFFFFVEDFLWLVWPLKFTQTPLLDKSDKNINFTYTHMGLLIRPQDYTVIREDLCWTSQSSLKAKLRCLAMNWRWNACQITKKCSYCMHMHVH